MANYETLKSAIQQVVKTNGNNEITGALLQQSLLAMINSLGAGYQFVGVATPSTNPGTPDQKVFYFATTTGIYANFDSLKIEAGEIAILKYDSQWTKITTGIASEEDISNIKNIIPNVIDGKYANKNNGNIETLTSVYCCTDYIRCDLFNTIRVLTYTGNDNSGICFYDANKSFISGFNPYSTSGILTQITVPENAAFVVVTCLMNNKNKLKVETDNFYYSLAFLLSLITAIQKDIDKIPDDVFYDETNVPFTYQSGAINMNGTYVPSLVNSYRVTKPILVNAGETLKIKCSCQSSIALVSKTNNVDDAVTRLHNPQLSGYDTATEIRNYEWTADEDCYVEISYVTTKGCVITKQTAITDALKARVALLEFYNLAKISPLAFNEVTTLTLTTTSGYYVQYNNSALVANSAYSVSQPIHLLMGQKLMFKASGQNVLALVAKTQNVQDLQSRTHKSVLAGRDSTVTVYDYEWTADEDCYVEISYYTARGLNDVRILNDNISILSNRVSALENASVNDFKNCLYQYAMGKILCIGDSLTQGAYPSGSQTTASIQQNYPYYLGRLLNCDVTNGGRSGYSPSDWYTQKIDEYDYSEYDSFIVWLGTNYGPTTEIPADEDIPTSTTETGYYCRIIERIKAERPDAFIVMANVFASKSTVQQVNERLVEIAAKYGCPLVNMTDISQSLHPELHNNASSNPHFGKVGNIFIANRFSDRIQKYIAESPMRGEFGVSVG